MARRALAGTGASIRALAGDTTGAVLDASVAAADADAAAGMPARVEAASIEPILARLPGGTRPMFCWPHAPRGSCRRARAAENSAPSNNTAAEKYSHMSRTASDPAAPNALAVPACVK